MKNRLGAIAWVVSGWVGLCLPAACADVKTDGSKIKVVVIDGQNNHNWRATTPVMKKALEDCGRFTVKVSTTPQPTARPTEGPDHVAFPPNLADFDVVLSNYNGATWPAEFQKNLEESLKAGKVALVIVHAANNSFSSWEEYNRMIGMGWRNNKFGDRLTLDASGKEVRAAKGVGPGAGHGAKHPFQIIVRDSEHPITKGMPHEWVHASDELYHGMRGPIESVHLLATAFSDKKFGGTGEHEPMIWTVSYGGGRVFHTPMGHDVEAMRCVGFITTLQRGTEWAATGKVSLPIPAAFPAAGKASSVRANSRTRTASSRLLLRVVGGLRFGRLAVRLVGGEAFVVGLEQVRMTLDDQQVLGVLCLRLVREIKATRDQRPFIDDHDLVVSDGVLGIDVRRQAFLDKRLQLRIRFLFVALIEQNLHVDSAALGGDQGFCDGLRSKRIGLHQDFAARPLDFVDDRICAAALWRVKHGDAWMPA
jgi:type 1 glutamine amidotransferase